MADSETRGMSPSHSGSTRSSNEQPMSSSCSLSPRSASGSSSLSNVICAHRQHQHQL